MSDISTFTVCVMLLVVLFGPSDCSHRESESLMQVIVQQMKGGSK